MCWQPPLCRERPVMRPKKKLSRTEQANVLTSASGLPRSFMPSAEELLHRSRHTLTAPITYRSVAANARPRRPFQKRNAVWLVSDGRRPLGVCSAHEKRSAAGALDGPVTWRRLNAKVLAAVLLHDLYTRPPATSTTTPAATHRALARHAVQLQV